jgi:hypothetical protein
MEGAFFVTWADDALNSALIVILLIIFILSKDKSLSCSSFNYL